MKKVNDALANLEKMAKEDGVSFSNETTKQNIYKKEYFEGVIDKDVEKGIRRKLRKLSEKYLLLLANTKDKKEFDVNYTKFKKFYNETFVFENYDFCAFDTLRSDSNIKLVSMAKEIVSKYTK